MNGIAVRVKVPTKAGRLYPHYDEDAGVMVVESRIERSWPFGVDVDGSLVFDLDEQRTLANFDLHIPRDRWLNTLEDDSLSMVAPVGDIEFLQQTIEQKSFHLPLRARTDRKQFRLRIDIGLVVPNRACALSGSCIALLAGDELAGFVLSGY